MYIMNITGHRPPGLPGGYKSNHHKLFEKLIDVCQRYYLVGYKTFISGGALGVDQIFARAVIYLRGMYPSIELVIAKPFPSQASRWIESSVREFNFIVSNANLVVDVSEDPYSPEKMQIRNKWMVDRAHTTVGVWNGGKGGTKNCLDYAIAQNRNVVVIDPTTLEEKILQQATTGDYKALSKSIEPGNIWSGNPALAALTNPTELAFSKGCLSKHYPITLDNVEYPDAEAAYQDLKWKYGDQHTLTTTMIHILKHKLLQYPELTDMITISGGVEWLARCSHEVYGKGNWEGIGADSQFIRCLIQAYKEVS